MQKRDHRLYFLPEGDPGFSPERNKQTIEKSIKKYEARRLKAIKQAYEEYGERADAVVTFLKAVERGKEANVDKYFGKRTLAALRGDEIRERLMSGMRIIKSGPKA